jgi:hypothetical protein
MPVLQLEPSWPKRPNNWVVGIVSAVTVDSRDHVWILQRPRTVAADQKAHAAPPVLEFDADGKFVQAWGGDGAGYDWPTTEHGITIDNKNRVWIGGSGAGDDALLTFTLQGKFLRARAAKVGNADTTNVNRPADIFVDAKTNEAYVADGMAIAAVVFDAGTGAFKREGARQSAGQIRWPVRPSRGRGRRRRRGRGAQPKPTRGKGRRALRQPRA